MEFKLRDTVCLRKVFVPCYPPSMHGPLEIIKLGPQGSLLIQCDDGEERSINKWDVIKVEETGPEFWASQPKSGKKIVEQPVSKEVDT